MVSSVGWGFEPTRPLCREFSAVTTRPRLLALGTLPYRLEMVHFYLKRITIKSEIQLKSKFEES